LTINLQIRTPTSSQGFDYTSLGINADKFIGIWLQVQTPTSLRWIWTEIFRFTCD